MLKAKWLLLFSLKFYKKHTVLIHMYIWLCINKMNSNYGNRDSKEEFTYLRVVYTHLSVTCLQVHMCMDVCAQGGQRWRHNIVCLPQSLFTLFLRQGLSLNWKFLDLSRLVEQPTPEVLLSPFLQYRELQVQKILCTFLCGCWESELSTSCLHHSPLLKSLPQSHGLLS